MPGRRGENGMLGRAAVSVATRIEPQGSSVRRNNREGRALVRRVAGDILRIAGAVGLAQVFALAAAPLVTRLYSPEAFGHLALFNAVVTIILPLTSLRYEWALPLPSKEARALDLLALCLLSVFISSLTLAALGMIIWPKVAEWSSGARSEIILLPFAVLAMGLHSVLRNWLVRHRAFSYVGRIRFTTTVSAVLCQIGLGLCFAGPTSLILGMIGGYSVGLTLAVCQCRRALSESAARMRVARIRHAAAEYRSFAIITAPSGIVNAIGSQLPGMILPSFYGLAVNGQYSLAQQVLSQPSVLIGQAVNEVLWGNAGRLLTEAPARLWPLFIHLNCYLLAIMMPGLVLTWFGPELFAFMFGSGWEQAGGFAGVMIIAGVFGLAAQGTTSLHVYRLNHWMCAWEVTQLALTLAALGLASQMSWSPMSCIIGLTAARGIAHVLLLVLNAIAIRRVGLHTARNPPPMR